MAEDNDDVREAIVDALLAEGFIVAEAKNGREALQKLERMPEPTLVLLDLMMPVMNGWEFLDAQQRDVRFAGHRVVTISAVEATRSLEDRTPLATDGALSKPLSLESIWGEVRKHCAAPSAQVAL